MRNLTAKELKVFNNLSNVHTSEADLGGVMQEIIDSVNNPHVPSGAPVNAVAASETLTVTGVVVHGEVVVIDNPLVSGMDVYEFVADSAQSVSDPTNIPVDITPYVTASTGSLTVDTQPTSGDTMTIGGKTYIFVPVGTDTADGEISIGADLAEAQANIVAAINGEDDINIANPVVSASIFNTNTDVSTITALVGGVAGDSIVTTETFTAGTNAFGAAALAGGADCTAANAITALVAAITNLDTQGVGASDEAGDTLVLTADVKGAAGNDIAIGVVMTNGSFTEDAEALSGGVDGTVANAGDIMFDDTYVYIAVDDNTIADANWRRIAVGAAY
jgi:hypothetical protein